MQEENSTRYSFVWIVFDQETDLGKALGLKEEVYFPYLIEGEDCDKFNEDISSIELNEKHLLFGLILGYKNPYPFGNHVKSISYFSSLIELLVENFNAKSVEHLLLNALHSFGKRHDSLTLLQAFEGCLFLLPESSKIVFDYCYLTWKTYQKGLVTEQLLKDILNQYLHKIHKKEIDPRALEALNELNNLIGQ
jgi:hypothetical protein